MTDAFTRGRTRPADPVIDVVIAGAGPDGLMVACELGLAGIRPVVLDPLPGPNPTPRVNGIVGQAARILDHRGLFSALTGMDAPTPAPHCGRRVEFFIHRLANALRG